MPAHKKTQEIPGFLCFSMFSFLPPLQAFIQGLTSEEELPRAWHWPELSPLHARVNALNCCPQIRRGFRSSEVWRFDDACCNFHRRISSRSADFRQSFRTPLALGQTVVTISPQLSPRWIANDSQADVPAGMHEAPRRHRNFTSQVSFPAVARTNAPLTPPLPPDCP